MMVLNLSLIHILKKENVFFKLDFNTKEDCLDFMIKKLEKDDIVKEGFRKSVYKRENIGSAVLENGVAIPLSLIHIWSNWQRQKQHYWGT